MFGKDPYMQLHILGLLFYIFEVENYLIKLQNKRA